MHKLPTLITTNPKTSRLKHLNRTPSPPAPTIFDLASPINKLHYLRKLMHFYHHNATKAYHVYQQHQTINYKTDNSQSSNKNSSASLESNISQTSTLSNFFTSLFCRHHLSTFSSLLLDSIYRITHNYIYPVNKRQKSFLQRLIIILLNCHYKEEPSIQQVHMIIDSSETSNAPTTSTKTNNLKTLNAKPFGSTTSSLASRQHQT